MLVFWENFELYMETQANKLKLLKNVENMSEIPSAADIISKLEFTLEKLTKENEELLSRKGDIFILFLLSDCSKTNTQNKLR